MRIIGIAGRKGSGKTTLAYYLSDLCELGHTELYAFADPLKRICIDLLGIDSHAVHGSELDKNTLTEIQQRDMPHWRSEYPGGDELLTVRQVMQQVGTEVFRKINPNCWLNGMKSALRTARYEDVDTVIIHDIRFENECRFVREHRGSLVKLKRGILSQDVHSSERDLPDSLFDLVVDNSALSPKETADKVYAALR